MKMPPRAQSVTYVFDQVAREFHMTGAMLRSARNVEPIRSIRIMATIVAIDALDLNLYAISKALGVDHTSVGWLRDRGRDRMRSSPWFRDQVHRLTDRIAADLSPANAYGRASQMVAEGARLSC